MPGVTVTWCVNWLHRRIFSLVCLQETKLETISDYDVIQLVGTSFDYVYLPAVQTRGGILVAWWSPS
jgi:hypothetical protein